MKKINLLAIIAAVLVIAVLAVALFFVFGNKTDNDKVNAVLDCSTISEVKDYVEKNNIEKYSFDTDICYLGDVAVLGSSAEIEILFTEGNTSEIRTTYSLFECIDEFATEEEAASVDVMNYVFTKEDRETIEKNFNKIKTAFEEKLGCKLEKYDTIRAYENLDYKDTDDMFYKGLFIKEYSVRDSSGCLWLLRYEASYGFSNAKLIKVVDEAGYEGFIPAIDMTKE